MLVFPSRRRETEFGVFQRVSLKRRLGRASPPRGGIIGGARADFGELVRDEDDDRMMWMARRRAADGGEVVTPRGDQQAEDMKIMS